VSSTGGLRRSQVALDRVGKAKRQKQKNTQKIKKKKNILGRSEKKIDDVSVVFNSFLISGLFDTI